MCRADQNCHPATAGSIAATNSAAFRNCLRSAKHNGTVSNSGAAMDLARYASAPQTPEASASQRGASGRIARSARITLANSSAVNNSSGIREKLNTTVTGLKAAISSNTYRSRRLNP